MTLQEQIATTTEAKEEILSLEQEIKGAVQADNTLSDLDPEDRDVGLWIFLVSIVTWIMSLVVKQKETDIQKTVDAGLAQNDFFIVAKLKAYQHGDPIEVNPTTFHPHYSVIDESKQVIKYVALDKLGNTFSQPRAIGIDGNGKAIRLSDQVAAGATSWLQSWIAGWNGSVISVDPDLARYELIVYYKPGSLATVQPSVEAAIDTYHLKIIDEKGVWRENGFKEEIRSVENVIDVDDTLIQFQPEGSTQWITPTRLYSTKAGFLDISPLYPLANNITYIAESI